MGLDSSLYSIDEEGWNRLEAQCKFRRRVGEMCKGRIGPIIDVLPKHTSGLIRVESLSQRQKNDFHAAMRDYEETMKKVALDFGVALDENLKCEEAGMGTEIYNFGGDDWDLYHFIVSNFWHGEGKANCVAIRLLEGDLERLVEFCGGDSGNSPEADAFAEALEEARNGRIVYYYPWY